MASAEARIQRLIRIGRKNGGITREQVRKYVVDQGASPSDLVVTFFRMLQEGIQIRDPIQDMVFQTKRRDARR